MVLIRRIEASRSIDIGGIPDTRVDNSIGQGLSQIGGALSNHADMQNQMALRRQQMEHKDRAFAEQQRLNRWNDDNALEFAKLEEGIAVSGEGFADTSSSVFTKRSEEFLRDVPPELQPRMQELVATAREQWINRGVAKQIDQRNKWFDTTLTERANKLQGQVFNDPAQFQASKEAMFREIDASDLPVTKKEAFRKKAEEMFSLAVGERDIRDAEANPDSVSGAASRLGVPAVGGDAVDVVVGKIIGVESGGKANAKNPNSSASGLGQFIDSTWINMVRKYRPDIANGRSNQDLITLKTNPQLGREMTKAYTKENAQFLANQGIQQTPGNIYLAHFLGPRGAVQVLKASPNTPIENIVGPGVVQANGFLRGKSASEVAAWASGKMGGAKAAMETAPADPRYANLSLTQRLSLYDQMQAAAQRGQTAIEAQQAAAYNQQKGALQLGIQTGEITSPQQILESGMNDSDKATLISALRSRQGDQMATAEAVAAYQSGNLRVDPYSTDGRKSVDAVGDVISKAVPADQQQPAYEELVRQSGTVPQSVLNSIRVGAASQTPAEVQQAMERASRFSQVNPSALSTREGGSGIQKQVDLYDSLKRNGYSAEEAAQRVAEQNDPELVAKRQAIVKSEPIQKVLKKVSATDVAKIFDPGWFSSARVGGEVTEDIVRIGASVESQAQIVADYKSFLEDAFAEANGNETIARELASTRMQKIYGLSDLSVFGSKTVMRLPPEKTYAPLPDGSYDYIKDQLHDALKAEGVDFDDAWLESYDATDADFQAGRPANYQIIYSKGGQIGLYQLPFFADRNAAVREYEAKKAAEDQAREAEWSANRDAELRKYPDGRDGPERFGNEELYRGIAREGSPLANAAAAAQQRQVSRDQIQSINQGSAAAMDDYLAGGDIPMGAGSAWSNPEAQQVGGVSGVLQQQRSQLFKDAENNGTLPKRKK